MGEAISFLREAFKWANTFGKKIIFFFLVLLILLFINNNFGLSYYYNLNKKVDAIIKLELLQNRSRDSSIIEFAADEKEDVLNHSTYLESAFSFFTKNHALAINTTTTSTPNRNANDPEISSINLFWLIISTGLMGYVLFFCITYISIKAKIKRHKKIKFIICLSLPCALISIVEFYLIKRLIPILGDVYGIYFALYLIINFTIVGIFYTSRPMNKIVKEFEVVAKQNN